MEYTEYLSGGVIQCLAISFIELEDYPLIFLRK
jgi:hypothetical protein